MKNILCVLLLSGCAALGATEETVSKTFTIAPGGTVEVQAAFGSIEVLTHPENTVSVQVWRSITRSSQEAERTYLTNHPIEFSQNGATLTVRSKGTSSWTFGLIRHNHNEAKYTLCLPAQFNARLDTAGGFIHVKDLNGQLHAGTAGGALEASNCQGKIDFSTSGGPMKLANCSGDLRASTAGGSVKIKSFKGSVRAETSGGGMAFEDVIGKLVASTSGGSITASVPAPLPGELELSTCGGGITLSAPQTIGFQLDAETVGGKLQSDLPVLVQGNLKHHSLHGTVNGGGPQVKLRTVGGSVHISERKL